MKNRIITTLAFFFLLSVSCDKTLELQPSESLSTQEVLADLPGMRTALYGVYNTLQSYEYYGNLFLLYPELLANLVYVRHFGANTKPYVLPDRFYTYEMDAVFAPHQVWNACYRVISRTNKIIENIDQVEGDEEEKKQIKGEALALRAMAHFDLVRFFARPYSYGDPTKNLGVPIVLESVPFDYQPSRNFVKEVYEQVVTDLEDARKLLGNVGLYRFSNDAADALLARVSLYMEDWDKAEELTTYLIDESGRYFLEDDVGALFAAPGSPEEIFTLKFETSEDLGVNSILEVNNLGANYIPLELKGRGVIGISDDLRDLYEPDDMRNNFIQEYPDTPETEYFQSKFQEQDGVIGLHSPKILRLAEMYLIRAEARFMNGDPVGAREDINALRLSRGASEWIDPPNSIDDILHERQRELAFEGHTSFDYWRTNTTMVRIQCETPVQLPNAPCVVEASSYLTVQPIPQQEIDASNGKIEQNEGY